MPRLPLSISNASSKVVVFLHGLVADETVWLYPGDPHRSYASLLERDHGYTPLHLRYNSGLHISENAKRFSSLLEEFVTSYGAPMDELVLIGHSMGGLVLRAGAWYGARRDTHG